MKQFSVSDSRQTAALFVRKTGRASFFFPLSLSLFPPPDEPGAIKPKIDCAEEIQRRLWRGKEGGV